MIGLKADEWDMIMGGLEAFIQDEEQWAQDERIDVALDAKESIRRLQELYNKVTIIKQTMRHFETLMGANE
jgi:hypothetical protein